MSIFKKIGKFLGHVFVSLFNATKSAYLDLSDEQKAALHAGTGIVALINEMADNTAEEVLEAIHKKFPNLEPEEIAANILKLAGSFNLISDEVDTVEEALEALKQKLSSIKLEGKLWATLSHSFAAALAVLFAPPATKVAVIVSLLEFVYQHFIKKATGRDMQSDLMPD